MNHRGITDTSVLWFINMEIQDYYVVSLRDLKFILKLIANRIYIQEVVNEA